MEWFPENQKQGYPYRLATSRRHEFQGRIAKRRCLASKRCNASSINSKYLSPYIKLKLIEQAIKLWQASESPFWKLLACEQVHVGAAKPRDENVSLLWSLQILHFHPGNRRNIKPTTFHRKYELWQLRFLGKIVKIFHNNSRRDIRCWWSFAECLPRTHTWFQVVLLWQCGLRWCW